MLKHPEIEERGMVEAYVRRQLAPEDSAAFEEHYFQCGKCFDDVQLFEKFVAGVEHAGRTGLLDQTPEVGAERRKWLLPALAFASAAAVVLAGALIFVMVRQPSRDAGPEANVPVVILTASRSADAVTPLRVGSESRRVLLWIDLPEQSSGTRFGVTISSPDAQFSKSIHGLERNSSGALAASLPAADLPDGAYKVRLFNDQSPGQLIAEYRLTVARR